MSKKITSSDVAEYLDRLAAFSGQLDCTDKDVPRSAGRLATAAAVLLANLASAVSNSIKKNDS